MTIIFSGVYFSDRHGNQFDGDISSAKNDGHGSRDARSRRRTRCIIRTIFKDIIYIVSDPAEELYGLD